MLLSVFFLQLCFHIIRTNLQVGHRFISVAEVKLLAKRTVGQGKACTVHCVKGVIIGVWKSAIIWDWTNWGPGSATSNLESFVTCNFIKKKNVWTLLVDNWQNTPHLARKWVSILLGDDAYPKHICSLCWGKCDANNIPTENDIEMEVKASFISCL